MQENIHQAIMEDVMDLVIQVRPEGSRFEIYSDGEINLDPKFLLGFSS
jgi:hypothetical protein